MPTYITNDGEQITVENNRGLINQLRALSRDPEPDCLLFMAMTAERVLQQTGLSISIVSEDEFVSGLIQAGLLKEKK